VGCIGISGKYIGMSRRYFVKGIVGCIRISGKCFGISRRYFVGCIGIGMEGILE
jgi:hypothetical protein